MQISIGLAQNSQSLGHFKIIPLPGQVSCSQVANSTLPPTFCLHSWEMQLLHFTAQWSTDFAGGVLFETGLQDPSEEDEAEEPWGVFVGVLKAAPLMAAAEEIAVHSVEAALPEADDAVYHARAALARGKLGTSRSRESKDSTSRSGRSRSNASRRPSGVRRGTTSVMPVVCCLHVSTHAHNPMTRVVCRLIAGFFTPKQLRSTCNWPGN